MAYLKVIETSTTWICPKTGDYKIICVAGGQGGTYASGAPAPAIPGEGEPTSFGNYVTASGYGSSGARGKQYTLGGGGGYTFHAYGGAGGVGMGAASGAPGVTSPTINGGTGMKGNGYGAGGAGLAWASNYESWGGNGGKLMLGVVHLDQGQSIPCVVGAGGVAAQVISGVTAGNDGVIIIQEV